VYGKYLSTSEVSSLTAPRAADIRSVENWLNEKGVSFLRSPPSHVIEAVFTAESAEALLHTSFHHASNKATGQKVVRASDYSLPTDVQSAVAAVYGLHGLPLPPTARLDVKPPATPIANVTPEVLASTYNVSGVIPSGSTKNRQAIAEFQGQTMNETDLSSSFKEYFPGVSAAQAKVYKFVGDAGIGGAGIEASLDVDYIMGVAPGVLTEYWYQKSNDFCGDLQNWSDAILAAADPPLVHSVSYGWQGNMDKIGCKQAQIDDIDANFAKLAARGITIIFSSGDSGSGYSRMNFCPDHSSLAPDTVVEGVQYYDPMDMGNVGQCCEMASQDPEIIAWTFSPSVSATAMCNTSADTELSGSDNSTSVGVTAEECCEYSNDGFHEGYSFYAPNTCIMITKVEASKTTKGVLSAHVQKTAGLCHTYKNVTGTKKGKGHTSGGFPLKPDAMPKLYASWPASSPWVSAVGATRFVGQKVGGAEMATDQFGSGGGFSDNFAAFKDQAAAVQHYLKTVAPSHLPPAGSFATGGRATPDVAALGEGFQVIANGGVTSVGGTSASAPAFAGFVSLLNEARLAAGKPAMGYLNPFLYQNAAAFRDVTVGTNAIGRGTGPIRYGYPAAPGWDPATGLGTPNFEKLLVAALSAVSNDPEIIV